MKVTKVIVLTGVIEQKAQFKEGLLWKYEKGTILELTDTEISIPAWSEKPIILLEICYPQEDSQHTFSHSMIVVNRRSEKVYLRECWTTAQDKIHIQDGYAFFEEPAGKYRSVLLNNIPLPLDILQLDQYPAADEEILTHRIIKTVFGINPLNIHPTLGDARLHIYMILDQMRLNKDISEDQFHSLTLEFMRFLSPHQEQFFFKLLNNQENNIHKTLRRYLKEIWEKFPHLNVVNNSKLMKLDFYNGESIFAEISYADFQYKYDEVSIEAATNEIIPRIVELAPVTF